MLIMIDIVIIIILIQRVIIWKATLNFIVYDINKNIPANLV